VSGQHHIPSRLTLGEKEPHYPLNKRLGLRADLGTEEQTCHPCRKMNADCPTRNQSLYRVAEPSLLLICSRYLIINLLPIFWKKKRKNPKLGLWDSVLFVYLPSTFECMKLVMYIMTMDSGVALCMVCVCVCCQKCNKNYLNVITTIIVVTGNCLQ
jgi:hypothetical protein